MHNPAMPQKLELKPLHPDAFQGFVDGYVRDRARNAAFAYSLDQAFALKMIREQVETKLADGLSTKNEFMYQVVREGDRTPVGFVWYSIEDRGPHLHAVLHELRIEELHRREGYGKAVLGLIQVKARNAGAKRMHVSAFTHNLRARELLQGNGFLPVEQIFSSRL